MTTETMTDLLQPLALVMLTITTIALSRRVARLAGTDEHRRAPTTAARPERRPGGTR